MQNSERKPNFFIVGAPKCGTTSLAVYLNEHPSIFIPEIKEPNYFSEDLPTLRAVDNVKDYLNLFESTNNTESRIGDASTWYLYSSVAVPKILEFSANAKLIVMLRNPIAMAQSLHSQLLYNMVETEPDFEKAWNLQSEREGRWLLQYKQCCLIGEQLKRLISNTVGKDLKIILFDDFKMNSESVYRDVVKFLELEHYKLDSFDVHNSSKAMRFRKLNSFLKKLPQPLDKIFKKIKGLLGIKEVGLYKIFQKASVTTKKKDPLSEAFKKKLADEFQEDIELLGSLLHKDLSHWLS